MVEKAIEWFRYILMVVVNPLALGGYFYINYPNVSIDAMTTETTLSRFQNLVTLVIITHRAITYLTQKMISELNLHKRDALLHSVFPRNVADSALQRSNGHTFDAPADGGTDVKTTHCCVIFIDIVQSMKIAKGKTAQEWMQFLSHLFAAMDECGDLHGITRVETIGDCLLACSGVFDEKKDHRAMVARAAAFSVAVSERVRSIFTYPDSNEPLQVRVGLHFGEIAHCLTAGKSRRWCIFGDTVNIASRMQSTALPGTIHISPSVHELLDDRRFSTELRGMMDIKGVGSTKIFFLTAYNTFVSRSGV